MHITRVFSFIVMAALCARCSLQASTLKVYNTGPSDIEVQMKWTLKGDFVNFSSVPPGQATSCTVPAGAYWLRAL